VIRQTIVARAPSRALLRPNGNGASAAEPPNQARPRRATHSDLRRQHRDNTARSARSHMLLGSTMRCRLGTWVVMGWARKDRARRTLFRGGDRAASERRNADATRPDEATPSTTSSCSATAAKVDHRPRPAGVDHVPARLQHGRSAAAVNGAPLRSPPHGVTLRPMHQNANTMRGLVVSQAEDSWGQFSIGGSVGAASP
jgi:hypothetical protein